MDDDVFAGQPPMPQRTWATIPYLNRPWHYLGETANFCFFLLKQYFERSLGSRNLRWTCFDWLHVPRKERKAWSSSERASQTCSCYLNTNTHNSSSTKGDRRYLRCSSCSRARARKQPSSVEAARTTPTTPTTTTCCPTGQKARSRDHCCAANPFPGPI